MFPDRHSSLRRAVALLLLLPSLGTLQSCGRRVKQTPAAEKPLDAAVRQPPEPSPFEFMRAYIGGLSRLEGSIGQLKVSGRSSLVDQIAANRNAAIALRMSQLELQPFSTSRDSMRRDGAKSILSAYGVIGQSLDLQLDVAKQMDSAHTLTDLDGIRPRIAASKVAYQQGSALLVEATMLAFGSTLTASPIDTSASAPAALDMSAVEKDSLVHLLAESFGPELLQKQSDKDSGPLYAAKQLNLFLRKKWVLARH